MALLAKRVSFFLLVVFTSSLHIEARGGKSFTKKAHNNAPVSQPPTPAPSISPAPTSEISYAPTPNDGEIGYAPAPVEGDIGYAPAPVESDNPYGPYGGDFSEFSKRKTITATSTTSDVGNEEDNIPVDEVASERLGEHNVGSQYHYNNYYNSGYSNSGYSNYNKGYDSSYNYGNGYGNERQGMSDTRFLENGKYYYDQRSHASVKGNGNTEGYYGYGGKSKYEFDTMEEYEKLHGYPDTEKLYNYIP